MLDKPFESITAEDVLALRGSVPEQRTIEYKRQLPSKSEQDSHEFLADVSSFANALGGHVIYGVSATDGVPTDIHGLENVNPDQDILRLVEMLRSGIRERLQGVDFRAIGEFSNGPVLIVKVPPSYVGPHMITRSNRFYGRGTNGKFIMDVSDLRAAFSRSAELPERIRSWCAERRARIVAGDTPVLSPRPSSPLVLHVAPYSAFSARQLLTVRELGSREVSFSPPGSRGCNGRINLDGLAMYSGPNSHSVARAYCQVFRSGCVEGVHFAAATPDARAEGLVIASAWLEEQTIKACHAYVAQLSRLGIPSPFAIQLSILNVRGATLAASAWSDDEIHPIDRDDVVTPEVVIDAVPADLKAAARALRPALDAVWNACGYGESFNFDKDGNWQLRR